MILLLFRGRWILDGQKINYAISCSYREIAEKEFKNQLYKSDDQIDRNFACSMVDMLNYRSVFKTFC